MSVTKNDFIEKERKENQRIIEHIIESNTHSIENLDNYGLDMCNAKYWHMITAIESLKKKYPFLRFKIKESYDSSLYLTWKVKRFNLF